MKDEEYLLNTSDKDDQSSNLANDMTQRGLPDAWVFPDGLGGEVTEHRMFSLSFP